MAVGSAGSERGAGSAGEAETVWAGTPAPEVEGGDRIAPASWERDGHRLLPSGHCACQVGQVPSGPQLRLLCMRSVC